MADALVVQEQLRIRLTRNGAILYEQNFSPDDVAYTVHSSDRLVLAANMGAFQEANLGDIGASTPGEHLFIVVDRPITIAVNATTKDVVADVLVLVGSSITNLYFKNTDANNTATVEYLVTD